MDEAEELIRLCVRALVSQMSHAPGFELHMTRDCVLGLTDVPLADFNMLTLGPDPDAEGFLRRSVERARARRLPLLAVMSPHVAQVLAPVATELGLAAVGSAPLMVLRPGAPVAPARPQEVVRALGPERVRAAGDLIAAAFDAPRDAVARCIDSGMTETSGVETWLASGPEGPTSTVSLTVMGNTAGVSLMATAPEQQGRGTGRALLSEVIVDYRPVAWSASTSAPPRRACRCTRASASSRSPNCPSGCGPRTARPPGGTRCR